MKKMWSEEEVNAAIAEYAATHPAGGKLFLHNIATAIDDDDMGNSISIYFSFVSTSETPCLSMEDVPIMTVAAISGVDDPYVFSAMTIQGKSGGDLHAVVTKDGNSIIQIGEHPYSFNTQFIDTVQEL